MTKLKQFLCICVTISLLAFSLIASFPIIASAECNSEYREVDLGYLSVHMEDLCGEKVRTVGTADYLISFYMFEDFWLDKVIPVVVRSAGLPTPPENSSIEVCGIIEYCRLEGGFFYLNAQSWTYAEETMPEFQSLIIVPLFVLATLLAVMVYKKNRSKTNNSNM